MAKPGVEDAGGMDRVELKKHIQFARSEPVQIAFAIGPDGAAVVQMHRRKPGRALEKELKDGSPESKNHRWGTLQIDAEDPKLARVVVNKAAAGMSRKLSKALKGTGCSKVQIVLEDGTEVDVHEDPDDEAEAEQKAPTNGAQAAPDGQDAQQDAQQDSQVDPKALTSALTALVRRMLEAIKHDPSQKAALSELAIDAQTYLKRGDLEAAAAAAEVFRTALDDVSAAGVQSRGGAAEGQANGAAEPAPVETKQSGNHGASHPDAPVIAKARGAWTATRHKIEAELTKVTKQFVAAFTDHEMADELAASFNTRVSSVLQHLDAALAHKLDEVNNAQDAPNRAKLIDEAHQVIARYSQHISSDPTIKELDDNPFVPVALAKTLTATLSVLSKSIR